MFNRRLPLEAISATGPAEQLIEGSKKWASGQFGRRSGVNRDLTLGGGGLGEFGIWNGWFDMFMRKEAVGLNLKLEWP